MLRLRETQPSAQRSGSPGWQRSEGRGSAPFSRRSELSRRRDGSNGIFRSLGSRRRSARRHPLRPPKNRYRSTRSRTTATCPGAAAEHDVGRPYERNDSGRGSTPRGAAEHRRGRRIAVWAVGGFAIPGGLTLPEAVHSRRGTTIGGADARADAPSRVRGHAASEAASLTAGASGSGRPARAGQARDVAWQSGGIVQAATDARRTTPPRTCSTAGTPAWVACITSALIQTRPG